MALVVAGASYEDPQIQELRAPVHDAEALSAVLRDPTIGDFDVTELVNEPARKVARHIDALFSDKRPGDLLLLYFSCHGINFNGRLYFAATDTELKYPSTTGISSELVTELMGRSRSQRIVVLLDCCHSGLFAKGLLRKDIGSVGAVEQLQGRGRVVITASDAFEYAFEDGELSMDDSKPSIFTDAVVHGLKTGEADHDEDGWISVAELFDYVHDRVRQETSEQTPTISSVRQYGQLYVAKSLRPKIASTSALGEDETLRQLPDRAILRVQFVENSERFQHLREEVSFILQRALISQGIGIHSIFSRVKDVESFLEKAYRLRFSAPLEQIRDIVGIRIVALYISDVEAISEIIRSHFKVMSESASEQGDGSLSPFRYGSVHFVAQLTETYTGPRYDSVKGISFEIQVRSILMDAWDNVSQHLSYKTGASVPSRLRQEFMALGSLFYLADKNFSLLAEEVFALQRQAAESIISDTPNYDQEINQDTLSAYLMKKFSGRKHEPPAMVAALVEELKVLNYSSLLELNDIVDSQLRTFEPFEAERAQTEDASFTDVMAVRSILSLARQVERESGGREDLTERP